MIYCSIFYIYIYISICSDDKIRLLFTHNEGNLPIHQWLRECKKLLVKNEKAKNFGEKLSIGLKQPTNLKRKVAGYHKREPKPHVDNPGCFKCGHCRVSCPILQEGGTFRSTNTQKVYRIRQHLTCNSDREPV